MGSIPEINDTSNNMKRNSHNKSLNQQTIMQTLQKLMNHCKIYNSKQSHLTVMRLLILIYFNYTTMNNKQWKQWKHLISEIILC